MSDLYQRSIEVILANQHPSGAYIASPNMDDYAYCWFRDAAYIAYSMDLVGEKESAHRFHTWAAGVINHHSDRVARCLEKVAQGLSLLNEDILPTRYTLEGKISDGEWPNFQLDGYGTWLWALYKHIEAVQLKNFPEIWREATEIVGSYLIALWDHPNYDCWEEFPDKIHPYTLATIYAGLNAMDKLFNVNAARAVCDAILDTMLKHGVRNGRFVKYFGTTMVDASLLGLCTPYRMFGPGDPLIQATITRIEQDLRIRDGGIHRYASDTYYGGGEWILLAAWLGWYYTDVGQLKKAQELLTWIEAQADDEGNLPEQVPFNLINPEKYSPWIESRGEIAKPLLWSHAMYLILHHALEEGSSTSLQE